MTGDCHAGICGSPGVRFPRATRPDVVGELLPASGEGGGDTQVAWRWVRILGVPTVADRTAQTVVARRLEQKVEPIFHPDSYGYVRHEARGIEWR